MCKHIRQCIFVEEKQRSRTACFETGVRFPSPAHSVGNFGSKPITLDKLI